MSQVPDRRAAGNTHRPRDMARVRMTLPLVAITMGDPCGIGPEIIAKIAASTAFATEHRAFVVGDRKQLDRAIAHGRLNLRTERFEDAHTFLPLADVLHVLQVSELPPDLPHGRVDARAGAAAYAYVRKAIELATSGPVDAICTAPINKAALGAAAIDFPGHTEILAHFSGADDVAMMLISPELRVILVTIHCALRAAIAELSVAAELRVIRLAHVALRNLGIQAPRIAVAGLNPHAGEGGLFGDEDLEIIAPAIRRAQAEGIDASGPYPGDTVFAQARRGRFDIVVAQYHDQGLIPLKLLGVEHGVNVTVGLPFVRTSPDHGTAFDIAGMGLADESSLRRALETARDLAVRTRSQTRSAFPRGTNA